MLKPVYLRCVDVKNNHYKFYKMIPDEKNNTFLAEWGREGSKSQSKVYPLSKWNTIYREKIAKGYEDKSQHYALEAMPMQDVSRTTKDGAVYAPIADADVREFITNLVQMSKEVVAKNYNISADKVTQAMIDEAQGYIDAMTREYTAVAATDDIRSATVHVSAYNDTLVKLLNTVPRKVQKVSTVLVDTRLDVSRMRAAMAQQIRFEEDLLNNMRTCVTANIVYKQTESKVEQGEEKQITLLEAMGLTVTPCTQEEMKQVYGAFTDSDRREGLDKRVVKAYRVVNKETEKRFEKFKQDYKDSYNRFPCRLLWHGSRNENWWSIMRSGLRIRPSNAVYTGSMFGDGLYFAKKAKKSFGYTSSRHAYWTNGNSDVAIMALYNVAVGNQLHTDNNNNGISRMTWNEIRRRKDSDGNPYHSVYAHAGKYLRNDELIMYNEMQTTIKYIVVFKG